MLALLKQVRAKAVIGFVGGSDLPKITEQLAINGQDSKHQPIQIGIWPCPVLMPAVDCSPG